MKDHKSQNKAKKSCYSDFSGAALLILSRHKLLLSIFFLIVVLALTFFIGFSSRRVGKRLYAETSLLYEPNLSEQIEPPSDDAVLRMLNRHTLLMNVGKSLKFPRNEVQELGSSMQIAHRSGNPSSFRIRIYIQNTDKGKKAADAFAKAAVTAYRQMRRDNLNLRREAVAERRQVLQAELAELEKQERERPNPGKEIKSDRELRRAMIIHGLQLADANDACRKQLEPLVNSELNAVGDAVTGGEVPFFRTELIYAVIKAAGAAFILILCWLILEIYWGKIQNIAELKTIPEIFPLGKVGDGNNSIPDVVQKFQQFAGDSKTIFIGVLKGCFRADTVLQSFVYQYHTGKKKVLSLNIADKDHCQQLPDSVQKEIVIFSDNCGWIPVASANELSAEELSALLQDLRELENGFDYIFISCNEELKPSDPVFGQMLELADTVMLLAGKGGTPRILMNAAADKIAEDGKQFSVLLTSLKIILSAAGVFLAALIQGI